MKQDKKPFWEIKSLKQMTKKEWELLCDNCGICCLFKIEDETSGVLYYTNVTCKMFDLKTNRCFNYRDRSKLVPLCVKLTIKESDKFSLLPKTCSYRRLYEGKKIPSWHPLITGKQESVKESGLDIKSIAIKEYDIDLDLIENQVIHKEITSYIKEKTKNQQT